MIRKVFILILIILGITGVFNYNLLKYGIQQLIGQYKIVANSISINEYISQNDIPDSIKFKLSLISEVKEYAFENLALKYSENYSTIYDQHGKPLMWLLTASLPFQMVAREWSFPLVGRFTYKGFFNQKSAEKEFEGLKLKGWDVMIREVGGWSTLGWFKDPVLSEMLNRSTGKLAELIIHELTHGTLYVKDSVEFNENLASFVGIKGTEQFLKHRFGRTSKEYIEYINQVNDQELFTEHFLRGFDHLNKFYEKIEIPKKEDTLTKRRIINSILNHVDTLNLNNPILYKGMFENFIPNNAYFMSFQRYRSKQDQLMEDLKNTYGGDLEMYIQSLKTKFESL